MTETASLAEANPAEDRPRRLTAVCASDEHGSCIGTVYLWPPPRQGPYLVRCECPACNHVVGPSYGR